MYVYVCLCMYMLSYTCVLIVCWLFWTWISMIQLAVEMYVSVMLEMRFTAIQCIASE